jgi:hypothetical protein
MCPKSCFLGTVQTLQKQNVQSISGLHASFKA